MIICEQNVRSHSYTQSCDTQVVNVSLLWSMLLLTDLTVMSPLQLVAFVGVASSVISLECVLGVVRVQDYYKAK